MQLPAMPDDRSQLAPYAPPNPYQPTLDIIEGAEPMTTLDDRITTRLAALTEQRNAIPEDGKLPSLITREEHDAIRAQRAAPDGQIAAIHAAVAALAKLGTADHDTLWRDQLTAWRAISATNCWQQGPDSRCPYAGRGDESWALDSGD